MEERQTASGPSASLVWCPFPDRDSAKAIADRLLDEGLIGCANILGTIESMFVWDGERGSGEESAVLFKTNPKLLEALVTRLGELHPYDTPAIVGWHCDVAHSATTEWLDRVGIGKPE